jgi:hypothetical protein
VSGHVKMPPASHQVSATSLKLLIQQIHPHVRVERDSGMCLKLKVLAALRQRLPQFALSQICFTCTCTTNGYLGRSSMSARNQERRTLLYPGA